jgi:hypothetical protein
VEIEIDPAGNRYIIDTRTESCFLVMTTVSPPVAGRVSCSKLAATVPEAKKAITWLVPPRPTQTDDATQYDASARSAFNESADKAINKLSDEEFEIDGDFLDLVLENPALVGRGARIVPSIKGGKANGFKLYAIRPSSVWAKLGLMNGDTVHAINGHDLTSPDKALEVYTKVREADEIEIDLSRRGKPIRILYRIMR